MNYLTKQHYDFIEIGTSDFNTMIQTCSDESVGLSIEPLKFYLDKLPNKKNVKKLQVAMSDEDSETYIFYIKEDKIEKYKLPWWVRGSNSVGKPHKFTIKEIGEDLYYKIVTIEKIPTISWKSLLENVGVSSIGTLKIDTEGYDHVILKGYIDLCYSNPKLWAEEIIFEYHDDVSNIPELEKLMVHFSNYEGKREESDFILKKKIQKIPKIIHQTYKTKDLHPEIQKVVNGLKEMNPDYEYRFYDDNDCINFIRNNYQDDTLDYFLRINPNYGSARADFFRYLLLYKVGGVYLDIKSTTIKPLNTSIMPNDEYILTHWFPGTPWIDELNYHLGEFQNWHVICVPNHPFLKKTIELIKKNIDNYNGETGKKSVLRNTGPFVYSTAILSLLDNYQTDNFDSPIKHLKTPEEFGITYMATPVYHGNIYGPNCPENEPLIIKK